MSKTFKKTLSLILTLLLVFTFCLPAFAVPTTKETTKLPTIRLNGNGQTIYDKDGNKIYSGGVEVMDTLKPKLKEIVKNLVVAEATGNWDPYCDSLVEALAPSYTPIKLDNNGEASNGTHVSYNGSYDQGPSSDYYVYGYNYDWRADPYKLADELHSKILEIKQKTGAPKVNIESRCIAGMIPTAYIEKYGTKDINGIELISTASHGAKEFEAMLSGNLKFDRKSIDDFLKCFSTYEYFYEGWGAETTDLLQLGQALVTIINETEALGYGIDFVQKVFDRVKSNVLPRVLLEGYATFPGYWSMIGDEYFDDAVNFIFGDENDEKRTTYKGLIEKIEYYHNTAFKNQVSNLQNFVDNGGKLCIVAKYNINIIPITDENDVMSDGMFTTKAQSFGATCSKINNTLGKNYKTPADAVCTEHNHVSPDLRVDAATGAFPEYTWYCRDNWHDAYPDSARWLGHECFDYDGQMTVWDNANYPQYMQFNNTEILLPLTEKTPTTNGAQNNANQNFVQKAIALLKEFLDLIVRYFSGLIKK